MSAIRPPRKTTNLGLPVPGDLDYPTGADAITGYTDLAEAVDQLGTQGIPGPTGPAGPAGRGLWWAGTQAQYDQMAEHYPDRIYFIRPETLPSHYRDTVWADNPTCYFRLDEAGGDPFADEMGGPPARPQPTANLARNQPPLLPSGEGRSLGFTTGGVEIPAPTGIGNLNTVECWVREDASSADYRRTLLWAPPAGGVGFPWLFFCLETIAEVVNGPFDRYSASTAAQRRDADLPAAVPRGTPFHYAWTRPATNEQHLYINGVEVVHDTGAHFGTGLPGGDWTLGAGTAWPDNWGGQFRGRAQELAIYPYALSSTQVQDHWNAAQ
jgi:hypothetical protein